MGKRLTGKQAAFCEAYVRNGRKASGAYREVYDTRGMSDAAVHSKAWELLANAAVAARIDALEAEYERLSSLSKDEAVRMVTGFLRGSLADAFDPETGSVDVERLPGAVRPFVYRIRMAGGGVDVSVPDKKGLLELLGKWCGWEKPRDVNVNVKQKYKGIRIGFDDGEGDS